MNYKTLLGTKQILVLAIFCVSLVCIKWTYAEELAKQEQLTVNDLTAEEALELGKEYLATRKARQALPFLLKSAEAEILEGIELTGLVMSRINEPAFFERGQAFLKKAIENGSTKALEELAKIYLVGGLGIESDTVKAEELLEEARKKPGAKEAFYLLGKMAAEGINRKQSPSLAVSYMRKAEEAGSTTAMIALANLFIQGSLVDQDLQEAERLATNAFQLENGEGAFLLGLLEERYKEGAPNWERAGLWYEKGNDLGHPLCAKKLGDLALIEQWGSTIDAFDYYRQAVQSGEVSAAHAIGMMYEKGNQLKRDPIAAFGWFQIAAEGGYAEAENELGAKYATGRGVRMNKELAVQFFEKAAAKGMPLAKSNLAEMLLDDPEQRERAISLLKEVASQNANAAARLSVLLQEGNLVEAAYWAVKAASMNNQYEELADTMNNQLSTSQKEELKQKLKQ